MLDKNFAMKKILNQQTFKFLRSINRCKKPLFKAEKKKYIVDTCYISMFCCIQD